MPNLVSLTYFSLQILEKNSDGVISDFRISGQSLIKENCHNSKTSYDIDMKLGPVTKCDKRNKVTSKRFGNDVMLANYNVIVFSDLWPIWSNSRITNAKSVKLTFSLRATFYLTKTENRTKTFLAQFSHYCFE